MGKAYQIAKAAAKTVQFVTRCKGFKLKKKRENAAKEAQSLNKRIDVNRCKLRSKHTGAYLSRDFNADGLSSIPEGSRVVDIVWFARQDLTGLVFNETESYAQL